jgi:hypothetical protein
MTSERATYLRLEQNYGQLLADFRRRQADIATEYDTKLANWRLLRQQPTEPPDERSRAAFDEDDFSNNTWLH